MTTETGGKEDLRPENLLIMFEMTDRTAPHLPMAVENLLDLEPPHKLTLLEQVLSTTAPLLEQNLYH